MKLSFYRSILLTAMVLAAAIGTLAQGSVVPETAAAAKTFAGSKFDGEKLTFEGKASKLKLSIAIADLTFSSAVTPKGDQLSIRSIAESKGTMLKLFRYSFMQDYESVVDLSNFRITKTVKKDVQKQRVRDSEAEFDYQMKRVSYVETDPKDSNRPPRRIASEITAACSRFSTNPGISLCSTTGDWPTSCMSWRVRATTSGLVQGVGTSSTSGTSVRCASR